MSKRLTVHGEVAPGVMGPLTIEQPGILEYTFVKADFGGAVPVVGVVVFIDEANNKIIKADATTKLKPCHGLVSKILPGLKAEVQSTGILDFGADKEYTLGSPVYLSTTAGDLATDVSAYTDSNLVQEVGTCVDDTGTTKVLLHPQGANALFLEKIQRMLKGSVVTELSTMLSKGVSGGKAADTSADDLVLENDDPVGLTMQMPANDTATFGTSSAAIAAQAAKSYDMRLVMQPKPSNDDNAPAAMHVYINPHANSDADKLRVAFFGPDTYVGSAVQESMAAKFYDRAVFSGLYDPDNADNYGIISMQRDDEIIVATDILGKLEFRGDDPNVNSYVGYLGATIQGVATQAWTANQRGTAVEVHTTSDAADAVATRNLLIDKNGSVVMGGGQPTQATTLTLYRPLDMPSEGTMGRIDFTGMADAATNGDAGYVGVRIQGDADTSWDASGSSGQLSIFLNNDSALGEAGLEEMLRITEHSVKFSDAVHIFNDVDNEAILELRRTDDTLAVGSDLGTINFTGDDVATRWGSTAQHGARIRSEVTEDWDVNHFPADLQIWLGATQEASVTTTTARAARFWRDPLDDSLVLELISNDREDGANKRRVAIDFMGKKSGGESVTQARLRTGHSTASDDDASFLVLSTSNAAGTQTNNIVCYPDGELQFANIATDAGATVKLAVDGSGNVKENDSAWTEYHNYSPEIPGTMLIGDAVCLSTGKVKRSTTPKDPTCVGIFHTEGKLYATNSITGERPVKVRVDPEDVMSEMDTTEWAVIARVASAGDSREGSLTGLKVCDENGDIAAGDFLCTSSVAGRLMKQDDDLMHNYTVGKAMEAVSFTTKKKTVDGVYGFLYCG